MRSGQRWWLIAAVAAGVGEIVLARLTSAPGGITHRRFGLLREIVVMWGFFALTVACLWRVRKTRTVVITALVLGVLVRVAAISPKAPLSDDLYRYSWDGIVQTHGVDPYRYSPLAPQLASLRTSSWLFPAAYHNHTRINRPDVRTIYPPVAETWFTVIHLIVPISLRDRGFELVGLLVELAVLAVLLALLKGEARRRIALYALCPLPVLEAVQNAHVDGFAVLFVLAMFLALRRNRGNWAALALAAATLVKLYPALLLPLLVRQASGRQRLERAVIFAGAVALAYLPHVLAVGPKVLGYLPDYLKEEQYTTGTRYQLLGLLGVPDGVATKVVVTLMALVVAGVLVSRMSQERAGLTLFVAVLLLTTPVQPWYTLALVALVALTGDWWVLGIALGAYAVFFGTILRTHPLGYGQFGYGVAAVVAVVGYAVMAAGRQGMVPRWAGAQGRDVQP